MPIFYIYAKHFETNETYRVGRTTNRHDAVVMVAANYSSDKDYGILGDYYYYIVRKG